MKRERERDAMQCNAMHFIILSEFDMSIDKICVHVYCDLNRRPEKRYKPVCSVICISRIALFKSYLPYSVIGTHRFWKHPHENTLHQYGLARKTPLNC